MYFIDHNTRQTTWNDPRKTTRRGSPDPDRRSGGKRAYFLGPGEKDWKNTPSDASQCQVTLTVSPAESENVMTLPPNGYLQGMLIPHAGHTLAPHMPTCLRSAGGYDEDMEDKEIAFLTRQYSQTLESAEDLNARFSAIRDNMSSSMIEKDEVIKALRAENAALKSQSVRSSDSETKITDLEKQVAALKEELELARRNVATVPTPSPTPTPTPTPPPTASDISPSIDAAESLLSLLKRSAPIGSIASVKTNGVSPNETLRQTLRLCHTAAEALREKEQKTSRHLQASATLHDQHIKELKKSFESKHKDVVGWLCAQQRVVFQQLMSPDGSSRGAHHDRREGGSPNTTHPTGRAGVSASPVDTISRRPSLASGFLERKTSAVRRSKTRSASPPSSMVS